MLLPNLLSLSRIFLAFAFLQHAVIYRLGALILAMITDGLDGFLARRYNWQSKFGALIDPIADKFFVIFVLTILIREESLLPYEALILLCRDCSVILYGIYLACKGTLATYRFQAIWCGKATTLLQFGVLIGLTAGIPFPTYLYSIFIILGILALVELYFFDHSTPMIKI